jgi:hypothetical protein
VWGLFFMRLVRQEAQGNSTDAAGSYDPNWELAGLTEKEGAVVLVMALDCDRILQDNSAKLRAAFQGYRAAPGVPVPPAVTQAEQEHDAIVRSHVDQLRERLGEESFRTLSGYVKQQFGAWPFIHWEVFYRELANLDAAAAELEKQGRSEDAIGLRNYDRKLAGLTEAEGAILLEVAEDCERLMRAHYVKLREVAKEYRATHPLKDPVTGLPAARPAVPPPELAQVEEEGHRIVLTHISQLRERLGNESFGKVSVYARGRFSPKDAAQ